MAAPLVFAGPVPHDELTSRTTATLGPEPTGTPLPLSALPWPGHLIHPDGPDWPGLFVRTTAGGPDATAEAVYIHGLAGASANWTTIAGLLSPLATGYSIDLPGSGRSDPPAAGDYSVRQHVQSLAQTIRQVAHGPVHLVGNSLGGVLTTHLAAAHPELFRSLTLISPAVPDFRVTKDRGADYRLAALLAPGIARCAEPRLSGIGARQRVEGIVRLCFGDPSLVTDSDLAAATGEVIWRKDLPWTQRALLQELRELMKSYLRAGRHSFWGAAASIQLPTLVIWGTRDRLVDARLAQKTADRFPDATLLVLAGVGHVAQMEAPVPVVRAVAQLWADAEAGRGSHARGDDTPLAGSAVTPVTTDAVGTYVA